MHKMKDTLGQVIEHLNVDYREFGRFMDTDHGKLRRYVDGELSIPSDFIELLVERLPTINVSRLVGGEDGPLFREEPAVDFVKKATRVSKIKKGVDAEVTERVRTVRINEGKSQLEFAEEMGVSRDTQAAIENARQNPTTFYMKSLALKYGYNLNWVILGQLPKKQFDYTGSIEKIEKMEEENSYLNVVNRQLSRLLEEK